MGPRRLAVPLLVAAAAAILASCGGGGSPLAVGGQKPASNPADAAFLRSMTAHEKGSIAITRLAQRRAGRVELRGIARKMTDGQADDLRAFGQLGGGFAPAGVAPPTSAAAELRRVRHATSFDYEFMRTMIGQNERAIAIAREELRSGSDPALKQRAGAIASARQEELEQLKAWLHLWYGEIQPDPRPPRTAPPPEASPQV